MITPAEIRQKANRKYTAFLTSLLLDEPFFPLDIPFRKAKASDDYLDIKDWIERLRATSKVGLGYGYTVQFQTRNTRRYGQQTLPTRIMFENEADYVAFIKKKKEVAAFKEAMALIRQEIPALGEWLIQHPRQVIDHLAVWPDLLAVCRYFQQHPRPNLYIRELPLNVHTKFVEDHKAILRSLLDVILPTEAVRLDESHFERRFFLRYDEPLLRLRVLDEVLQQTYHLPTTDFSAPLSEVARLNLGRHRLLITENKINFLTLPPLENSFALFGSGFKVELLKDIPWLAEWPLFYWGDLDAQGFQILSQLRAHFPQTRSLMMDEATFTTFRHFAVAGTPATVEQLPHLTAAEHRLFTLLAEQTLRLEQERISQAYVIERLKEII